MAESKKNYSWDLGNEKVNIMGQCVCVSMTNVLVHSRCLEINAGCCSKQHPFTKLWCQQIETGSFRISVNWGLVN